MALESWAFREVEAGRSVDHVLRELLDGHTGCGALGVAAAVAIETMHRSYVTLPIATSQRIWQWDIRRSVQDLSPSAGLIGFDRPDSHYNAVVAANGRRCRKTDIRVLAGPLVLHEGDLGERAAVSITAFGNELPVDYAEARNDDAAVADLKRTSEIWAELGRRENYHATVKDDGTGIIVQLENPKTQGPEFDAMQERTIAINDQSGLLLWTEESLKKQSVSSRMPLEDALKRARRLDASGLFSEGYLHTDDRHRRQAAVVGVAAVVLQLALDVDEDNWRWAAETCLSAWATPEESNDYFVRESALIFHPVLFAVKGLTGLLRFGGVSSEEDDNAVLSLIRCSKDPYDQIVIEALKGLLSLWDCRPELAWTGLALACDLSWVSSARLVPEEREALDEQHREACVQRALDRVSLVGAPTTPIPAPPPAWVRAAEGEEHMRIHSGRSSRYEWRHHETVLDEELLSKILEAIPVAVALSDSGRREFFLRISAIVTGHFG